MTLAEAEKACLESMGVKPAAHTPTPWWLNKANGSDDEICSGHSGLDAESQSKIITVAIAHGPQGEWGKVGAEHKANAAFIVKAVNAHDSARELYAKAVAVLPQIANPLIHESLQKAALDFIAKAEGK